MEYEKIDYDKLFFDGFFSEYLPSCFTLSALKNDLKLHDLVFNKFRKGVNNNIRMFIEPIRYTMSRFTNNNARRNIYLPDFFGME